MSICIKKRCIKYVLFMYLLFKCALLIFLLMSGIWLFTQCPSEEIKIDRESYDKHADQYIDDVRRFLERGECRYKYQNITYKEEELYNGDYRRELKVSFSKNSTLNISIDYYYSIERFSIDWYINADEYGPGKSGIDWDIVVGILDIVSGYPFTKEKLSYFVENALENNVVDYKSYRDYYKIHDNESINFMEDWKMYYSVQENNRGSDSPLPKYSTIFTVTGLTKTGMKP